MLIACIVFIVFLSGDYCLLSWVIIAVQKVPGWQGGEESDTQDFLSDVYDKHKDLEQR